jgi:hypothetical protein
MIVLLSVPDETVEVPCPDLLAARDPSVKLLKNSASHFTAGFGSGQDHHVAMGVGLDAEPSLDQGQMRVIFPKKLGQIPIVLEGDDQTPLGV